MRRLLFLLTACFLLPIVSLSAAVVPQAAYHLSAEQGAIRDTAAPAVLRSWIKGGPDLAVHGSPKVMSNAPEARRQDYTGSIKFEQQNECYSVARNVVNGERFVLEAWAYALKADDGGFHTIVANGNGGSGFLLCQYNDNWSVLVGGVGDTSLGKVEPNKWTHLAIVKSGDRFTGWIDGKRTARLPNLSRGTENFAIGATAPGHEAFHGWIAEVRYSTFDPGKFDPTTDFLLDSRKLKRIRAEATKANAARVEGLLTEPGVRVVSKLDETPATDDWLIAPPLTHASLQVLPGPGNQSATIMLSNGLVSRTFLAGDNLACVSMRRSDKALEFIRTVKPEVRFRVDGSDWQEVGGMTGAPEHAYLVKQWLAEMESKPSAFRFTGMTVGEPVKPYAWSPKCNSLPMPWPAKGVRVAFHFAPPAGASAPLKDLLVDVVFELYDGLPVFMKSFAIHNRSGKEIVVNQINGEYLAVLQDGVPLMHVESDYSFALANANDSGSALGLESGGSRNPYHDYYAGAGSTRWESDPEYGSAATLNPAEDLFLNNPERCLLVSRPSTGPGCAVRPGEEFQAMRTFEILNDTNEKERFFLAQRRFYNTLAPQTTEYQIELHDATHDLNGLKHAIDQMAEVGFDRLQIEYPEGISYGDASPGNIRWLKEVCDYGKARGIRIGGYELMMASQSRSSADGVHQNCIVPGTTDKEGSAFGQSGCGASRWGEEYAANMFKLIDATGLGSFDPDGPYHGDPCASTHHSGHRGLEDSQWMQWRWMCNILHECQRRNLYVTLPDWYFLNGGACTGMGYREASDGLPLSLQTMVHRQYMFDGTYHKTAGMGWINFDLGTLRGGPEKDLARYEFKLFQMLSYGAQTWLRGGELYDGPKSKAMVRRLVDWSKKYREIIRGDIIHLRRPDGQSLDYVLHVRPGNKQKGMLLVFNSTSQSIAQEIPLPLYYTGLTDVALIREKEGDSKRYRLDRQFGVRLPVTVPAGGYTWFVIE